VACTECGLEMPAQLYRDAIEEMKDALCDEPPG
jgi:hypothetical protein